MPQHVKRIKIDRKALRQPDEFQTLSTQAGTWVREHQTLALAALAAVAVLIVVAALVSRVRASRTQAAAVDFRAAHEMFEAGKYPEAAKAFGDLADAYASTPFGTLGTLYRGHALLRQGDGTAAVGAYQNFLASAVVSPDLRQEALMGLATAREKTGDTAGAREAYAQAAEGPGPFRTDALLAGARLDEAQGRTAEAHATYEQLLKGDVDPELRALLSTKVAADAQRPAPPAAAP